MNVKTVAAAGISALLALSITSTNAQNTWIEYDNVGNYAFGPNPNNPTLHPVVQIAGLNCQNAAAGHGATFGAWSVPYEGGSTLNYGYFIRGATCPSTTDSFVQVYNTYPAKSRAIIAFTQEAEPEIIWPTETKIGIL